MEDFFKYLTVGEEDREWGLYLNVSGRSHVGPYKTYPSRAHPSSYYFSWGNGRVLQEYQVNYITEGSGELETRAGKFKIKPGTLMLLPRGLWHRYRPKKQQGWTENYIGFSGALAVHYFSRYFKKKTGFNPSELRQKLT